MRILYERDGKAAILTPTAKFLESLTGADEEKAIYGANKDLPTGTKYEIIADSVDLSDRAFRDAWEYVAGASEKTSADLTAEQLARHNMTENK
tara:strand:+ start:245 stop:523 length:279 start_codon:yes stop_codon:yes gene_type:complete